QEVRVAQPPTVATADRIGDAWNDRRNPIVRIFGGQRLDLWSLRPVHKAASDKDAAQSIDRFLIASLRAAAIEPAQAADARTLARRLYFDLTGLPPAMSDVMAFESATRREGIEKASSTLVDSLLASPRFGEHFARMWLDVVRYSDS